MKGTFDKIIMRVIKDMFHDELHFRTFMDLCMMCEKINKIIMTEEFLIIDRQTLKVVTKLFDLKISGEKEKYRPNSPSLVNEDLTVAGNQWGSDSNRTYVGEEKLIEFKNRYIIVKKSDMINIDAI